MNEPRRCTAIRDYVAKTDDELSFKEGDIIFVPKRVPGDRWQGVFNGKVGWFPKIYVDDKTVEVQAGKTTRVRALRDYTANGEEELSFPKDAVMFVVRRENEKYWFGVYEGKQGLIPAGVVENADEKKVEVKWEGTKCKAIKSHVTTEAGKLPFKVGDSIFVPKPDPDLENWQGVCNNQVGSFPRAYVVDTKGMTDEQIKSLVDAAMVDDGEIKAGEALAKIREEQSKKLDQARSLGGSQGEEQKPTASSEPASSSAGEGQSAAASAASDAVNESKLSPKV